MGKYLSCTTNIGRNRQNIIFKGEKINIYAGRLNYQYSRLVKHVIFLTLKLLVAELADTK